MIDNVFADMPQLPEIVAFVLVPAIKDDPKDVSDLAIRSPSGVTYKTDAPAEALILNGFVAVFGVDIVNGEHETPLLSTVIWLVL